MHPMTYRRKTLELQMGRQVERFFPWTGPERRITSGVFLRILKAFPHSGQIIA